MDAEKSGQDSSYHYRPYPFNKAGIVCSKVPRLGNESDVQSERR